MKYFPLFLPVKDRAIAVSGVGGAGLTGPALMLLDFAARTAASLTQSSRHEENAL